MILEFAQITMLLMTLNHPSLDITKNYTDIVGDKNPVMTDLTLVAPPQTSVSVDQNQLGTVTNVRLDDEIGGPNNYKDLTKMLQDAKSTDTIIFHLAGYGGDVEGALDIINNIKLSRAKIIMEVEAPVFSAHAYIAVSGSELRMAPYTFLMFHESSAASQDCSKEAGKDRGVRNSVHCQASKDADLRLNTLFINNVDLLTDAEKKAIMSGHDVYLHADDVFNRTHAPVATPVAPPAGK